MEKKFALLFVLTVGINSFAQDVECKIEGGKSGGVTVSVLESLNKDEVLVRSSDGLGWVGEKSWTATYATQLRVSRDLRYFVLAGVAATDTNAYTSAFEMHLKHVSGQKYIKGSMRVGRYVAVDSAFGGSSFMGPNRKYELICE